ncbi:MAG: hypothetical protein AAFU61_10770, partial [Pseudomonadota bacterium]
MKRHRPGSSPVVAGQGPTQDARNAVGRRRRPSDICHEDLALRVGGKRSSGCEIGRRRCGDLGREGRRGEAEALCGVYPKAGQSGGLAGSGDALRHGHRFQRFSQDQRLSHSGLRDVAALAQALGLEERRNNQLDARLSALNATLSDAQTQVDAQAARIAALTSERDAQTAALAAANTRITSFEAQVAALIAERDGALDTVAGLQEAQATLLSEQEALNLALAQARTEIDAGTEAARLAAARTEALQALIADLRARNAEGADQTAALQADLDAAQTALSAEEAARLAEAAAAEALRARLEQADAELTAMTLALEVQRQEAEDTLTLLAAARAAELLTRSRHVLADEYAADDAFRRRAPNFT